MRIQVFCALLIFLSPASLKAGEAWTLQKGEAWVETSLSYIAYDQLWQGNDPFRNTNRSVQDLGLYLSAEYGLFDRWTIYGQVPIRFLSTSEEIADQASFADTLNAGSMNFPGNLRFGARYQVLRKGSNVLSVQMTIESNNSDMDQRIALQTGFDAWSFEPLVAFGKSFDNSYLSGNLGMVSRTNQYSEEFRARLEYGIKPFGEWWLMALMDYRLSFQNGERPPCNMAQTGLYVNNQEGISYGVKTLVPAWKNIGFSAGVYGAFYARDLPAAFSFNAGLYWNPRFGSKVASALSNPGEGQ